MIATVEYTHIPVCYICGVWGALFCVEIPMNISSEHTHTTHNGGIFCRMHFEMRFSGYTFRERMGNVVMVAICGDRGTGLTCGQ